MQPLDEAKLHEGYLARLPPDGRARLFEPTDEELVPLPYFTSLVGKHLPAKDWPGTPGRFLSVLPASIMGEAPAKFAWWSRLPADLKWWGDGYGLDRLKQRPRWFPWLKRRPCVTIKRSPARFPELWSASKALVASPEACALIRALEPAIETVDIDYRFEDGTSRDGYVVLDFTERRYAYDFTRSDVRVYLNNGRRYLSLGKKRTLRDDIPANAHAFRSLGEPDLLFSRELAEQIEELAPGQFQYFDHNLGEGVALVTQRIRKKRARAAPAAPTSQTAPLDPAQVWKELTPLLRSCDLVAAERLLVESLRATPGSPYHVAADLRIETAPETVAHYFDSFLAETLPKHRVAAVYCEMNGFTINPQEWFCSAFGFDQDGGRDGYEWLGDFNTFAEGNLVIRGLEALQDVFAESEVLDRSDEAPFRNARAFAERLVIVKFQRMLQDALPSMRKLDVPLLAAAHDWYEYVVEIRPATA